MRAATSLAAAAAPLLAAAPALAQEEAQAAARELELRRPVRHLRPRRRAARLPGLQGSLLELPFDASWRTTATSRASAWTREQIKAIAASVTVPTIGDDGQPAERPALPSDHFRSPFANEKAARAALNGALPPDLSVIVQRPRGRRRLRLRHPDRLRRAAGGHEDGRRDELQQILPRPSDRHAAAAAATTR